MNQGAHSDIQLSAPTPTSDDELLARLAGRGRTNPHVPVDQARVKWETIFIVVILVAVGIVLVPLLVHMTRHKQPTFAPQPTRAVEQPSAPTSSMTKTEAQSIVAQARTSMLAGKFDAAGDLLDRVAGELSDDTGASELRDENARRQTTSTDSLAAIQSAMTSGDWPTVHTSLTELATVQPLTVEQQALDTRAMRESKMSSELASIHKLLDGGDAKGALARAQKDQTRFGDSRFTALAKQAATQLAADAPVKVAPVKAQPAAPAPTAANMETTVPKADAPVTSTDPDILNMNSPVAGTPSGVEPDDNNWTAPLRQ